MNQNDMLRSHLLKLLSWRDAHVDFAAAIEDIPAEFYGVQPEGVPYSLWQLLEHMRSAAILRMRSQSGPTTTGPRPRRRPRRKPGTQASLLSALIRGR